MGFRSISKYFGIFVMVTGIARRVNEWYQMVTSDTSEGGNEITADEWFALGDIILAAAAEAFEISTVEAKEKMFG